MTDEQKKTVKSIIDDKLTWTPYREACQEALDTIAAYEATIADLRADIVESDRIIPKLSETIADLRAANDALGKQIARQAEEEAFQSRFKKLTAGATDRRLAEKQAEIDGLEATITKMQKNIDFLDDVIGHDEAILDRLRELLPEKRVDQHGVIYWEAGEDSKEIIRLLHGQQQENAK